MTAKVNSKKEGGKFEQSIEQAAKDQSIWFFRVRDVNPLALKPGFGTAKNKYDALFFYKGYLFPSELKSTKDNKISMKEHMIKAHQIKSLTEANQYDKVIPGFIFNFREPENRAFFVHIDKFVKYKNIAENQLEHTYKNKINKSSIPLRIVEEIGVEIVNVKKQVNHRYYVSQLLENLIKKYLTKEGVNY